MRGRGGPVQHSKAREGTFQTDESITVAVPPPEQIITSVRSYHLFNINEIFNEVQDWRLISPSLISTGEI